MYFSVEHLIIIVLCGLLLPLLFAFAIAEPASSMMIIEQILHGLNDFMYFITPFMVLIAAGIIIKIAFIDRIFIHEDYDDLDDAKDDVNEKALYSTSNTNETINTMLSALYYLDVDIKDIEVSKYIKKISNTHKAISDYIDLHPEFRPSIRKYEHYYIPSIIKMLEHYKQIDGVSFSGDRAKEQRQKIVELLKEADVAFSKLLDSLVDKQSIDINSDIKVFRSLMSSDGLLVEDNAFTSKNESHKARNNPQVIDTEENQINQQDFYVLNTLETTTVQEQEGENNRQDFYISSDGFRAFCKEAKYLRQK